MWIDKQPGGFAVVTLAKEPANVMDLAFWQGLTAILDELEADSSMHGVIFSSGLKRDIFTAGSTHNRHLPQAALHCWRACACLLVTALQSASSACCTLHDRPLLFSVEYARCRPCV